MGFNSAFKGLIFYYSWRKCKGVGICVIYVRLCGNTFVYNNRC